MELQTGYGSRITAAEYPVLYLLLQITGLQIAHPRVNELQLQTLYTATGYVA